MPLPAHTPLPWQICEETTKCGNTVLGRSTVIGTAHNVPGQPERIVARGPEASGWRDEAAAQWEADAALIDLAVRSLAPLSSSLEMILHVVLIAQEKHGKIITDELLVASMAALKTAGVKPTVLISGVSRTVTDKNQTGQPNPA